MNSGVVALLLTISFVASAAAQTPAKRFAIAKKEFMSHRSSGFAHDDQPAAIASLQAVWRAFKEETVDYLNSHPKARSAELETHLCFFSLSGTDEKDGCRFQDARVHSAVSLAHGLFVVSQSQEGFGTVFVAGPQGEANAVLWELSNAAPQPNDAHDLVGAWKAERAGMACRDEKSGRSHKPGACGPLYATVGWLPEDSKHRPRFYINAGYTQGFGGTIGSQTTIWRWDGDHATLVWCDWYNTMIDQEVGTSSYYGTLRIAEKQEMRSAYDCGMCASRLVVHTVLLTPNGVADLGKRSLTPELDVFDEVLVRLMLHRPVGSLASSSVAQLLTQRIQDARENLPANNREGTITFGMIGEHTVQLTAKGANLCFSADEFGGTVRFSLIRQSNGGYFIAHALPVKENSPLCPTAAPGFPPDQMDSSISQP